MKISGKWKQLMAFALGLPSTIFGITLVLDQLVEKKIITKNSSSGILVFFLISTVFTLIIYATPKKN